MPSIAPPPRAEAAPTAPVGWLAPALLLTLLVTGLRILGLWFNRTDLFVDEAQYWLWGQEPALGYYSKPPMIAWVIGATTRICGDSPFCVRLPAPLFQGATALILGAVTARLVGELSRRRAALLVVAGWLTLPMVALGSLLISTDTIMFPFLALALLAWAACLRGASAGVALLGGLSLGFGFLSKYAAAYYLLGGALAATLRPRLSPRQALGFLAGFLLAAAPNLLWNLGNGLATVQHTLDNAAWVRAPAARAGLNLAGAAEFLAAQFAVFGPVLFGAMLLLALRWRARDGWQRRWLLLALPILGLVTAQALLSHAYANWAAAAYLPATLVVLPWLGRVSRPWLRLSFALNVALSLALPLATIFPTLIAPGGHPAAERYLGRAALSRTIIGVARAEGLTTVVSGNRDLLADLFYTGRDSGLRFAALPPHGRALHHYALRYPYEGGAGEVLMADQGAAPCAEAVLLHEEYPVSGAWRGRSISLWRVPDACLAAR